MDTFELPQTVLLHPRMTLTALRLYRLVDLFTKNREYCELMITKVADQLDVSIKSVFNARKLLEDLAFIEAVGTRPALTKLKTVESQYIAKVDNEMLYDSEIRLSDVQLAALEKSLTRDRKCFASRRYLAKFLGITVEEISRSRKRIQESVKKRTQILITIDIGKKSSLAAGKKAHSKTRHIRYDRLIEHDDPSRILEGTQARSLRNLAPLKDMDKEKPDPTSELEEAFANPEFKKKMARVEKRKTRAPKARSLLNRNRLLIENADSWSITQMFEYVMALSTAYGVPNWYTATEGAVSASAALAQMKAFCLVTEADLSSRAKLAAFLKLWFENWPLFCRAYPKAVEIGFNPTYWKTGAWKNVKTFILPLADQAPKAPISKIFSIDEF